MRSGAVDFMTKPFIMDEFLKRIESGRRSGEITPAATCLGYRP